MWTGGGGGTKVGCFGAGGGGERLRAGCSGDTENEWRIVGIAEVGGVGVVSAQQGPLGRPSDGGEATRSETGDGAGVGAADRAGALATKSVSQVWVAGEYGREMKVLAEFRNCGPPVVVDSVGCPGFAV